MVYEEHFYVFGNPGGHRKSRSCSRMFRSPHFVTSSCLLGTYGSLLMTVTNSPKQNIKRISCSDLLLKHFCMAKREEGPQWKQHCTLKPQNSTCILQQIHKLFSVRYSSLSEHFVLPPENKTDEHIHGSIKCQKSNHTIAKTSFTKGLWTPYQEGRNHHGPLISQNCGVHRHVPQQAALEDCLSAENMARCRVHLQPNATLYDKETKKGWAAVLVALCTVGGEPSFLFTLRSSKLRGKHKGDVSFAGGKQDPSDSNVVETALREAREELGITVTENEVWGVLKPLTDGSGMMIAPVLANLGPLEALVLNPNPSEVEEIFTLTVAHVYNPQNRGYTHFCTGNRYSYTLPVFHNHKYRIWGLTAVALDLTLKLIMQPETQ